MKTSRLKAEHATALLIALYAGGTVSITPAMRALRIERLVASPLCLAISNALHCEQAWCRVHYAQSGPLAILAIAIVRPLSAFLSPIKRLYGCMFVLPQKVRSKVASVAE